MYDRESFDLEFKEKITKTFLKTVSAFSNYNDGKIIFGVNNSAKVIGIDVSDEECLRIENMINDSINPVPEYILEIKDIEDKSIIVLSIFKGKYTPYYFNNKAYRRSDTSTMEVDRLELNRLVLEGFNMDYEEKKSSKQDLTFEMLESKLKNIIGIDDLSVDILKTLKLFNKEDGYNLAGALLSDDNSNEFAGIDIVKFGKDINKILNRNILKGNSVLVQYDSTVEIFERYYQYEEIEGYNRITREMIPKEAFREALANAIVHRTWDVKTNIQISMFDDRIEIVSPGGLMNGISEEDYFKGNVSVLRNPILADVFYRLNLIEKFGTGITRIIKEYKDSIYKPRFEIGVNNIKVILPVIGSDESLLSEDEALIYNILKSSDELSRMQLDNMSGFNKAKTIRTVNNLLDKNIVKKQGKGPKTTYILDE